MIAASVYAAVRLRPSYSVYLWGGLLIPLVWVYAGLKADEDMLEFRIAQHSLY